MRPNRKLLIRNFLVRTFWFFRPHKQTPHIELALFESFPLFTKLNFWFHKCNFVWKFSNSTAAVKLLTLKCEFKFWNISRLNFQKPNRKRPTSLLSPFFNQSLISIILIQYRIKSYDLNLHTGRVWLWSDCADLVQCAESALYTIPLIELISSILMIFLRILLDASAMLT